MRMFLRFLVAAALLLTGCATASQGVLDPRTAEFEPPGFTPPVLEEATLKGGAPLFLLEDHDVPLVRVYLAFMGGAIHDPKGLSGLASVTSSSWRSGGTAERTAEEFDDFLAARAIDIGIRLGRESGSASLSVLPAYLDQGLDALAELLLNPAFEPEKVEWAVNKRLDALAREEDSPETVAFRELRRALYAGHPRGEHPTPQSLGAITRDDVVGLHRALVNESAWVLGAVGDFDPEVMVQKLEERFGALLPATTRFELVEPPREPGPQVIEVDKDLAQTTMVWASFAPERLSPQRAPMELADKILGGGGFQSRITREVRIKRGLAYDTGSFYSALEQFGVVGVYATTGSENTAQVWKLLADEVDRAGSEPFEPGEVASARQATLNRYIFRFRDPADGVLERMGLALRGLPADLTKRLYDELGKVQGRDITGAAADYYRAGRGVWVIVGKIPPGQRIWAGEGSGGDGG